MAYFTRTAKCLIREQDFLIELIAKLKCERKDTTRKIYQATRDLKDVRRTISALRYLPRAIKNNPSLDAHIKDRINGD